MAVQVTFYKRGRKPLKKTYKRYAPQLTVSYRQLVDMGYKVVKVEKVGWKSDFFAISLSRNRFAGPRTTVFDPRGPNFRALKR